MDELKGKRVFIIEDDPTNMAVFSVTLKRSGAVVLQDFWNTDSINMLQKRLPIDVIVLDLMLRHQMNGYAIFEELRADPELSKIPVVIVSAADPGIEIPKAQARGLAGFIGKPIRPYLFPTQIASCINGNPVWYSQHGTLEDFT
jgi:CheY-like chemotaxis protein